MFFNYRQKPFSWLLSPVLCLFLVLLISCSPTEATLPGIQSPQASQLADSGQKLPISAQAIIAGRTINLEVAQTRQQQAIGLMYRNSVADNRGMLFTFDPPQPVRFWMKNVRIPLDMIFIRDGQVKGIEVAAPPCNQQPCPTFGPGTAVNQVIELRGGLVTKLGLKVGDRIELKYLSSPSRQS